MDAVLHGEAKTVRLPWFMIRILSEDDHLDLVEGAMLESVEDEWTRRIDRCLPILLPHEVRELLEIVFLKFVCELFFPALFNFYLHITKKS